MGLLINGDTQFFTNGLEIKKADLNQVYLDLQWVTPIGTDSVVQVTFHKYTDTTLSEAVKTSIDGIPNGIDIIDATDSIIAADGLMNLNMGQLHDDVIAKLVVDYPGFAGKITKYDPFVIP